MPTPTMTAELSSTLRMAVMRLARRLRAERADTSLSLSQMAALGSLVRFGSLTPGELAEVEKVQPPSMTRTVASLEARGLVSRMPHPQDRRQVLLTATPEAEAMVRADRRRRDAWMSQRLSELTPAEREKLRAAAEILERLADA
ncbi:MAG TPA: MarR family transcriptional regulator [Actinomycetes bacterium]|nr:MarR family transcriptional regulator [Actinomycetes bacterium]